MGGHLFFDPRAQADAPPHNARQPFSPLLEPTWWIEWEAFECYEVAVDFYCLCISEPTHILPRAEDVW